MSARPSLATSAEPGSPAPSIWSVGIPTPCSTICAGSRGNGLDPCLLDTILAAVRFIGGEEAKPWWAYTKERKRELAARREADQEGQP